MNRIAVDIGASSGRVIVSADGNLDEVFRFKTGFITEKGHEINDINALVGNIKKGIKKAFSKYGAIETMAIDTWGVDYVLMKGDEEVMPVYGYRDGRTSDVINEVHSLIPFKDLYRLTGCQYQPFNSIYQLYWDNKAGRLDGVTDFLMLPEYIAYKLTGVKLKEYTNATTTGLVNPKTKVFEKQIITRLGLPGSLFGSLHDAGENVGNFLPEVEAETGGNCTVKLCLTHDTASAVYGIPSGHSGLYISSGTWSLLGVCRNDPITNENAYKANYSNEGGINKSVRFQKNITGMFAVNNCMDELNIKNPAEFMKMGEKSGLELTIDLNDEAYLSKKNFVNKIRNDIKLNGYNKELSDGDISSVVHHSLAKLYTMAIRELESATGEKYDRISIVGGGANNTYLNALTEKYSGLKVNAYPIEATAIGNLKAQEINK